MWKMKPVISSDALALMQKYGISARLTFSNSLLREEHLSDKRCNTLCALFSESSRVQNGVIIHSELLLDYLKENYPELVLRFFYNKSADGF